MTAGTVVAAPSVLPLATLRSAKALRQFATTSPEFYRHLQACHPELASGSTYAAAQPVAAQSPSLGQFMRHAGWFRTLLLGHPKSDHLQKAGAAVPRALLPPLALLGAATLGAAFVGVSAPVTAVIAIGAALAMTRTSVDMVKIRRGFEASQDAASRAAATLQRIDDALEEEAAVFLANNFTLWRQFLNGELAQAIRTDIDGLKHERLTVQQQLETTQRLLDDLQRRLQRYEATLASLSEMEGVAYHALHDLVGRVKARVASLKQAEAWLTEQRIVPLEAECAALEALVRDVSSVGDDLEACQAADRELQRSGHLAADSLAAAAMMSEGIEGFLARMLRIIRNVQRITVIEQSTPPLQLPEDLGLVETALRLAAEPQPVD